MKEKNVLITGGAGFIGSHLVEHYLKKNITPVVVDINIDPLSYFAKNNFIKKTHYYSTDIGNTKKLAVIFKKHKPSTVYHLAAISGVNDAMKDIHNTFQLNTMGTVSVLECCRMSNFVKSIVAASSDKVYGDVPNKKKHEEGDILVGNHPYEVSKMTTDLIARMYYHTFGMPVTVARFGNVYGQGDFHFYRIIPGLMAAISTNKTFVIRSDGTFVRDYLYIKDVIAGYISLATNISKTIGQAFNFGSDDNLSVMDIINTAEAMLGKKVAYKIANTQKNEIPYQSLNWGKINKTVSWKPVNRLKNVLPEVYKWYSKYISTSKIDN